MRWFRSHARSISCVALTALALQLALALGHIHPKDLLGDAHASTPIDAATVSAHEQQAHAPPTDREPHDHEDEYCAIYAINGLIASAQVTQPPALPSAPRLCCGQPFVGHESPPAQLRHILSQARAPPTP
jgi:hypothetical protein